MKIQHDYSRIKAALHRNPSGHWVCHISGVNGVLLLTVVAARRDDGIAKLVQAALGCLSWRDLRKAV